MPPIEHLYLHIPFCPKLCPYCCFYVEEGSRNKNIAFLDALLGELDAAMRDRPVLPKTIYFGGGTPTALLTEQLEYLLEGLRSRLPLQHLQEWTVEANPATIRPEKAQVLRDAGVTRISLGVQSWNAGTLKTLGRVHSAQQAHKTYDLLRKTGFPAINIDLMFSVPGQTPEEWEQDLQTTLALQPDHISAYCLTYEEDTEYFRKLSTGQFVQSEEKDARMFERTMDVLAAGEFRQYEISNHARSGFESKHNLAYWEGREYLGLGPSAFSTIDGERLQNVRDTAEYVKRVRSEQSAVLTRESLSPETLLKESVAFGLRLDTGVSASLLAPWLEETTHLEEIGLLERAQERFKLTRRGRMLADAVGERFM
ncbi:MAG: radical SAM family heme chaperone HemW [Verrucomicrobiota bacterium]